jgi:hypothetical protein
VANPGGSATNRLARIAAEGSVLASVHSHTEELINMIPQPDGKLILGNRTGSWGDSPAGGAVRLLANGERDPSFRVELGGTQPEVQGNRFRAPLPTQPGVAYEAWPRSRLNGEDAQLAERLDGDGYVQDVDLPADRESLFLEPRQR